VHAVDMGRTLGSRDRGRLLWILGAAARTNASHVRPMIAAFAVAVAASGHCHVSIHARTLVV
jgi:hypothetical protein